MFKPKRESAAAAKVEPVDAVQDARGRARQRLIGAIVLLAIGIIGFPLVFETQPRPIPVDIPIEIPRRDSLPPLAMPPARSTTPGPSASAARAARPSDGVMITESAADAGREIAPPRAGVANERAAPQVAARAATTGAAAASQVAARPATTSAPAASQVAARAGSASAPARRASAPAVAAAPPAARSANDGERAQAILEGRAAASADEQRFVVQVGAFADSESARETRRQVEKLGLKTYTQVAQTTQGSRIRVRVGPFASRNEADAAIAKVKAAGLNAVVLTL